MKQSEEYFKKTLSRRHGGLLTLRATSWPSHWARVQRVAWRGSIARNNNHVQGWLSCLGGSRGIQGSAGSTQQRGHRGLKLLATGLTCMLADTQLQRRFGGVCLPWLQLGWFWATSSWCWDGLGPWVERVHPWDISIATAVVTDYPCIPLLTSKRNSGCLAHPRGTKPPEPCCYTLQPRISMPNGTDPYKNVTAQTAVFTSGFIANHLALLKHATASPCFLLPSAHAPRPGDPWLGPLDVPPQEAFLFLCSCPPQLLAHAFPCVRNTNLKCNTWIKLIIQLIVDTTHLLLFHGLFSKFKTHLRKKMQNQIQKKISLPGQILSMLWTNKTSV